MELNEYEQAVVNYMRQGAQIDINYFRVNTAAEALERVSMFPESAEREVTDCTKGDEPYFVCYSAVTDKVKIRCFVNVERG